MIHGALGLIETRGLIGAIEACDAAAKAAAVNVATAELTEAAYMTIKIEGDLSAVQAAVEAGARAAERVSELISAHVIPRPDAELAAMMPERRYISKYHQDDDRPPFHPDATPQPKPPRAPDGAPDRASDKTERRAPKPAPRAITPAAPAVKPPPAPTPPKPEKEADRPLSMAELEELSVVKLRRYARTLTNLPIKGRQISMANKEQLLEAIKKIMDQQ